SHKRMDLLQNYVYRDVDTYCENIPGHEEKAKEGKWTFTGTLSHNPPMVRNKFGGRWLTTEFQAGDFLTFGMFVVHASLDNRTQNRLRISSDSRYQRASEPIDDRWIGVNPPGHSKAGKRGRIC
ncbi:MAG: phytanoyl-CoA dioxygenase, partial [Verrucomicrobiae bacterium]|nr:phytanoyl-CoA dioxygenase [Verrucomicrobiae bacterium]